MSLIKETSTLTHNALSAFIMQQSRLDNSYQLVQLEKHPQYSTVNDKAKTLVKIFGNQTYKTAKQKGLFSSTLDPQQINQLRRLTVLNLLQVKQQIQLAKLSNQLQLDKLPLYRLLTQMSTKNLISIKINQKTGVVQILASKRRRQPIQTREQFIAECQQRLFSILASNNRLVQSLVKNQIDVV